MQLVVEKIQVHKINVCLFVCLSFTIRPAAVAQR